MEIKVFLKRGSIIGRVKVVDIDWDLVVDISSCEEGVFECVELEVAVLEEFFFGGRRRWIE